VDRERLRVADVREVAEQLQALDERLAGRRAAAHAERDERAVAAAQHAISDLAIRARRQAGVVDPLDRLVPGQVLGDGQAVLRVALHPQRQRLDALQEQERVERRERRSGVAQQHRARPPDVSGRAERVAPDDAVVGRVGLRQPGEAIGVRDPVEAAGVDDRAADRSAVAADELRQRVHGDVGALLEDARADRRRHGVVEHERQPCRVRRVSPRRDVEHVQPRVADRLAEDQPRVLVGQARDGARVVGVGPANLDAVLRQRVREQVVGTSVELRDGDDVVARTGHVQHRVGHRRLT
jgi:hypothetical protein